MKFSAPYAEALVDLAYTCRNWTTNSAGTDVRQSNRADPIRATAAAVNRCAGRLPRIWFSKTQPLSVADAVGSDPLYVWTALDNVTNGRSYTVRILAVPRTAGTGDCYAGRSGGSSTEATPLANSIAAASVTLADSFVASFPVVRGAAAGAEIEEGLSTYNGYTVLDVVVQDDELKELDHTLHAYAAAGAARKGNKVLADVVESVRAGMRSVRTTNLPVWGWSAMCDAGSWATPGSTTSQAIVIASTTYVNLLDQTFTTRTATSPGSTHLAQYTGIGRADQTVGKRVKVMCRVFAAVDGGASSGYVRFEGPDHLANNYCDIEVTPGVAAAWYGGSSDFVYLNPASGPTDTTTARNKVDAFGLVATAPTNTLYVYATSRYMVVD